MKKRLCDFHSVCLNEICLNFDILVHSKFHAGSSMFKFMLEQSLESQNASYRNGPKFLLSKFIPNRNAGIKILFHYYCVTKEALIGNIIKKAYCGFWVHTNLNFNVSTWACSDYPSKARHLSAN